MAKCKDVKFKRSEIEYLLSLVEQNKREGVYWGRRDYFEARQDRFIAKLRHALATKAPE